VTCRRVPFVAVQDKRATLNLFRPSYCKLDWRLFDPLELASSFDGDAYIGQAKALPKAS